MSPGVPESVGDLFAGESLQTILGRPLREIPYPAAEELITRARVLVTGAGGSVGNALVPAPLSLRPAQVIALDHHEAELFALGRTLGTHAPVDLRLADVRNGAKLRRLFLECRPQVVFHLAAYKHVPLGEREVDEPVSVNVFGTEAVAQACLAAEVQQLVYPSSDKAVNPPSVYGSTKRLAETLLRSYALRSPGLQTHIVRYVNILGSSGSVLETFAAQTRAGLPLTLTDRRMTRYWMVMAEAVALLWHAVGQPNGSLTLLDVGEPIPVEQMARRVYRLLNGQRAEPTFVETGARPGERLAEELCSTSESLIPCGEEPVLRVVHSRADEHPALIDAMLAELRALVDCGDVERLRARVTEFGRQLQ
jgi:FlaA1/EpsC-like NDP-sugar epimerase